MDAQLFEAQGEEIHHNCIHNARDALVGVTVACVIYQHEREEGSSQRLEIGEKRTYKNIPPQCRCVFYL